MMYQPHLTTLKNGLKLVVMPMPQVESTTVMVGVGAGSRFETKSVNGLFHFIEHMAFKGTKKRPSALAIALEVDSVGGKFNAYTDKEFTSYYLKLAAVHQEMAFDILADVLNNSLFKKEEIEKEKGVIIEEINLYKDTPARKVWDDFIRLLYGDNPMGWSVTGKKENVRAIQRRHFLAYLNRLYYPGNMVVAVAGKISQKQAQELTQKYFAGFQKKGQKKVERIIPDKNGARVKLVSQKTEQAHFCLGVPGYELAHPDRFALGVLATILGGGWSARLWMEIRERLGLAYYIDCSPDFYSDSGFLVVRGGVKIEKIEEVIRVVLAEFNHLIRKKVSLKELKKAQEFNKGRLVLALEDSQAVANRYAYQALLEKAIRTPQQTMKLIDRVTPDDLWRVARDIFRPEKLNLALIGPYKDKKRFKKLLS